MKNIRYIALAAIVAAFVAAPFAAGYLTTPSLAEGKGDSVKFEKVTTGKYTLDPAHSLIGFAVKHMEVNFVEGKFDKFSGAVDFNEADPTKSTVTFTASVDSINTGIAPRDGHLKSPDFFDAKTYPELSFKSTSIKKNGKAGYLVEGDLTMRGVTKRISFPFTFTGAVMDPWGNRRFGIEATTTINRKDFGINYGNALPIGGFDVANDVQVRLRLEAIKPEPKK